MPDNDYIADQFSRLAKLMDIHGENSFKIKSYSVAAFTIEKLPQQLSGLSPAEIISIKGIGDAIGKKIAGILATGELALLEEFREKTPPGVIEMLNLKGLGPKKIATIWKEMGIESIGELLYACQENRLLLYRGFGEKTQKNTRDTIEFYLRSQGSHLYSEVEAYTQKMDKLLHTHFGDTPLALTGEYRRQLEIIDRLDWVIAGDLPAIRHFFESHDFIYEAEEELQPSAAAAGFSPGSMPGPITYIRFKSPEHLSLGIYCCPAANFAATLFTTSCSPAFLEEWTAIAGWNPASGHGSGYGSEEEIFSHAGIPFIPAAEREQASVIERFRTSDPYGTRNPSALSGPADSTVPASAGSASNLRTPIQPSDIRGIIHSHSVWSDGSNTLEEMAKACIDQGFEYLVISDHSKSAFYAQGLKEDQIKEQRLQIAALNKELAPFTIFHSIESDILNDGQLDYSDEVLAGFDLVIASVHSNLKMNEEKAMMRVLKAVENPYTTILGHMTGRLLLSRPGYPLDTKKVIDACAANKVVIELNAHPRRLDIDWRWIRYALEKGVLLSVDPDAHSITGYKDIKYGVLAAQKAGLTKDRNLSSFPLAQFRSFIAERRAARGV
ncbi:MAG: PHP domain-containing protein [Puia sp.]|nr:PHP domain-containing protein [Puia sp.]